MIFRDFFVRKNAADGFFGGSAERSNVKRETDSTPSSEREREVSWRYPIWRRASSVDERAIVSRVCDSPPKKTRQVRVVAAASGVSVRRATVSASARPRKTFESDGSEGAGAAGVSRGSTTPLEIETNASDGVSNRISVRGDGGKIRSNATAQDESTEPRRDQRNE